MHVVVNVDRVTPYQVVYDGIVDAANADTPIYASQVYARLAARPDVMRDIQEMPLSQLYELDLLFCNQGGAFLMEDYNRPKEGTCIRIDGVWHQVNKTAIFTFDATPLEHTGENCV